MSSDSILYSHSHLKSKTDTIFELRGKIRRWWAMSRHQ